MESFSCKPELYLGSLDTVNHVILNKKSYLHLERASSGMNTLVLCNLEEEMVSELKVGRNICKCFNFSVIFVLVVNDFCLSHQFCCLLCIRSEVCTAERVNSPNFVVYGILVSACKLQK